MEVLIAGKKARLGPRKLIGQGGEACVYRWRHLAVKIYHPMAKRCLARRIAKIKQFPAGLPEPVLGPLDVVSDPSGREVGFTMRRVEDVEDLRRLSQRLWREGVVPNRVVVDRLSQLHEALGELHQSGVVVGDLNDSNVVFDPQQVYLIDADSMQYGRNRCEVGHPRFLDPALYGIDLAAHGGFTAGSDWYAFAVLLFSSLLYVHPFGGVHPDYPTLLRRAEARHSLMRGDVQMPKSAQHWRTLPDQLSGWFLSVFENDRRDAFPVHLLDVVWTRCGCGVEHARSACPECTDTVPVPASQVTRSAGSCRALTIHRSDGRILSAAAEGRLRYAYEAGGVVYRENGQRVMAQEVSPGMRFVIAGDSTYVIWQGQVVEMRNERVVWRTATAMFDACEDRCFVLRDDWLVEERSGSRIGRILAGQTWFRVGAELGYGFYQAGQITVHFLFRTDRPGLTQIDLPHLRGRLVDVRVAFDRRRLVVGFVTELDGQRTETLTLVGDDGRIVASMAGPVDRGLALSNGQLLQATDEGLLRVRADNPRGVLTPTELFTDTEPFVAADSGLLPGPDGTVYLICPREILQLSLA